MEMKPTNPGRSQAAFLELSAALESLINRHMKHRLIEGCAAAARLMLLPDFSALAFALCFSFFSVRGKVNYSLSVVIVCEGARQTQSWCEGEDRHVWLERGEAGLPFPRQFLFRWLTRLLNFSEYLGFGHTERLQQRCEFPIVLDCSLMS